MEACTIREAAGEDAPALNRLSRESLGYPYPLEAAREQLEAVLRDPGQKVLVAESGGQVVGYLHLQDYVTLYAPPMKNVLGIAVDPAFRRRGVGAALLGAGEAWARAAGAAGVRLCSGEGRRGAHAFYRALGYRGEKLQLNLKKLW